MQWPIICDLTRTNHCTPFILPRFWGVVTKSSRSNLETSHRECSIPHKRPSAILLVNVWPIVMRINYDVKARRKTIGTLHLLVFYSESVSHTDRTIGPVWMHLNMGSLMVFGLRYYLLFFMITKNRTIANTTTTTAPITPPINALLVLGGPTGFAVPLTEVTTNYTHNNEKAKSSDLYTKWIFRLLYEICLRDIVFDFFWEPSYTMSLLHVWSDSCIVAIGNSFNTSKWIVDPFIRRWTSTIHIQSCNAGLFLMLTWPHTMSFGGQLQSYGLVHSTLGSTTHSITS